LTAVDIAGVPTDRRRRVPGAATALAVVAAVYVLLQIWLGALRFPLNLDEDVYASQFAAGVARIPYAAHRSLGEGLLAAPLTMWTSSVVALRAYFIVLSGVLLYLAFRPWLRHGPVAPVAAALFATTWVALRYGATVLPNQPIALGAVAAAGLAVRRGRSSWIGLFVTFAGLTLIRPTDAAWIAFLLLAAMVLVRAWRSPANLAGAVAGIVVGGAAWVIEAYARFGGPFTRLTAMQQVNDASGLHFVLLRYLATMNGRESCNPAVVDCGPVTFFSLLWWVGGLLLVAAGLVAAWRTDRRPALVLCVVTAAAVGAAYLFLSAWAVPRYLMPAFALLAVPAAEGVIGLIRAAYDRRRPLAVIAAVVTVAGLVVDTGFQATAAERAKRATHDYLDWSVGVSNALAERGVTGRCAVLGTFAPQIAYLRHCLAADMHDGLGDRDASGDVTTANVLRLQNRGLRVIVVAHRPPATPGVGWWRPPEVPGHGRLGVYLGE
jgi:hypothetical protein